MIDLRALIGVLGCSPRQPQVQTLLEHIVDIKVTSTEPEVKAYPDIVYHSYRDLGLSLQYEAQGSGKDASEAALDDLRLVAIDIYSAHGDKRWTCFPGLPLQIDAYCSGVRAGSPTRAAISRDATGKQLVRLLGEPQRKGGGAGGRSGPAAWMEWSFQLSPSEPEQAKEIKILIELAGDGARGVDRWNAERAGTCHWGVITIS